MGVLGHALERVAEGLLDRGVLVAEGAGQLAHEDVGDDHRRQLAAGEDVAADRELVVDKVLVDAVVEALVASAEQRQVRLGDQLVGDLVAQHRPGRREQHDPRPRPPAVGGPQGGVDHVDPQHHAGAAAVGRVVDLAGAQRGRLAVVDQPQLVALGERVGDGALRPQPLEGLGKEGEDVESHRSRQ